MREGKTNVKYETKKYPSIYFKADYMFTDLVSFKTKITKALDNNFTAYLYTLTLG